VRISKGKKNWYYPNYFRRGKIRNNTYILDELNIRFDDEQSININ